MAGDEEKSISNLWGLLSSDAEKEAVVARITIHRVDNKDDKGRPGDQISEVKVLCPATFEDAQIKDPRTFIYVQQELVERGIQGEVAYCMGRDDIDRLYTAVNDPVQLRRAVPEDAEVARWVKGWVEQEHALHVGGARLSEEERALFNRIIDHPHVRRETGLTDKEAAEMKPKMGEGYRCNSPEQARERNALADRMGAAGMLGASRAASMLDNLSNDDLFGNFHIVLEARRLGEQIRENPHNVAYAIAEITPLAEACDLTPPPGTKPATPRQR